VSELRVTVSEWAGVRHHHLPDARLLLAARCSLAVVVCRSFVRCWLIRAVVCRWRATLTDEEINDRGDVWSVLPVLWLLRTHAMSFRIVELGRVGPHMKASELRALFVPFHSMANV